MIFNFRDVNIALETIRNDAATLTEDWPGMRDDYIREMAVELAVSLADHVIMQMSRGTAEETDYLTAQVAKKFTEKLLISIQTTLHSKELMERSKERTKQ